MIFYICERYSLLPGVFVPVRHGRLDHHRTKTCTRFSKEMGKNRQRIKNMFCLFKCSNLKQKKNLQFAFIANKCWVFLQTFWQTSIFRFVRGAVIKILSFQALQDTNKFVLAEMKREQVLLILSLISRQHSAMSDRHRSLTQCYL